MTQIQIPRAVPPENESPEHRLKRLRMRSMRRGIKEMDIILVRYCEARLALMDAAMLDTYEVLLEENDQDLYQWVSGQIEAPESLRQMIADIKATACAP
ncbi:succinate dehydrogenase assembly factor 2 [Salipiger sp. 1_MG-2023]|uniref:FAD assembly factor SdhE n=1 Tax=Salipiger sp. 1_MG-2023 TaxID=3062665 RepID=UPI0026E1D755|nr:succinate dehydrogenase assembly factor 2 [Salipiger sp. 1_MG-2023]MDO6588281.1 succinate dehydrogenase assembly factor 2 [Salipiger sp. 1_MG-2023]